ncbi:MAG TPA: glycosyltransferase family 4 protein [Gaiellaceae bacterium]
MPRPRLLVLNQYYWPGVEATAHLLSELCEALSRDYEVTVVTGRLHAFPDLPDRERRNGVEIVRVRSTAYERSRLLPRASNYASYLAEALRAGLAAEPPDVVLCMTDPPVVADVALLVARRFRAPLVVISEDVFPEIAVALKRLENPVAVGLLRLLVRFYLRRADRLVAIGETMRRRLEEKGAAPESISVIPNWVDVEAITPASRNNEWARSHGLTRRFVVMHSGNVGHAQNLDTLVRSATLLRDLEALRVVIIGTGARRHELIALARTLEVGAVRFLPYQPRELLSETLSAADVHVVGLATGLAGYVVPSRLYGIMAAGKPVIAAADPESETAQLVDEVGCGLVVPPGNSLRLAEAIRSCHDGHVDLESMGRRARAFAEAQADRSIAMRRYRELIHEVQASAAAG